MVIPKPASIEESEYLAICIANVNMNVYTNTLNMQEIVPIKRSLNDSRCSFKDFERIVF